MRKYLNIVDGDAANFIEVASASDAMILANLLDKYRVPVEVFLLDDGQELDDRDTIFMNDALAEIAREAATEEVKKAFQ